MNVNCYMQEIFRSFLVSFPTIIICANAMHDMAKIEKLYPWMNSTIINFIYGDGALNFKGEEGLEEKLRNITLRQFQIETRSPYWIRRCIFGHEECTSRM